MNIAVFCSSRNDIDPKHVADASAVGDWIGANGHTLVYGGIALGLMKTVADAVKDAGGRVTGVVPELRRGLASTINDTTIEVGDLHERKRVMENLADGFIALAGGYGTLDELVSTWTSLTFNGDVKPIAVLDSTGLYAPLRQLIDRMTEEKLLDRTTAQNIFFAPDVKSATEHIGQSVPKKRGNTKSTT